MDIFFAAYSCLVNGYTPSDLLSDGVVTFHEYCQIDEVFNILCKSKSYTKKTPPSKGRALGHSEAAVVQLNLIFD